MCEWIFTYLFFFFLPYQINSTDVTTITTKSRLEVVNDQKILHLEGTPYEIGHQQGTLLKKEITANIDRFIEPIQAENSVLLPLISHFMEAIPQIIPHIPQSLVEEMQGIADGSDQPFKNILLLNLFPEMFHCSGITVKGEATGSGELYHVRVLDYSAGNGLQNTAVLTVVKPNEGKPFLNATYAGFVGCVTGMNQEKIAIGEIGGKGYGHWNGVPMAFLLRTILQQASTLDEVKQILTESPRTCEYFYVFSDGKTGDSFGCYATPDILEFFAPGEDYSKHQPLQNTFGTGFYSNGQTDVDHTTLYVQPKDVLMISRSDNYDLLKDRLLSNYGHISLESLQEAIKYPVAHKTNLHNAIFAPKTLDVWISHASESNEPACDQPYHHFNLTSLMDD